MHKEIQVVIVEDDPYARDLMGMLLARDWRARVAAEFESAAEREMKAFFSNPHNPMDVVIVDTEIPSAPHGYAQVAQIVRSRERPPVLLYTCTQPDAHTFSHLVQAACGGYVVKRELLYGLASAVAYAAQGYFVITPGVKELAQAVELPRPWVSLDGGPAAIRFTQRESDLVRLGVLFNMSQKDMADELVLSTDFVAEVMGQVYEKLGLRELRTGELTLESLFEDEDLVARIRAVLPIDDAGQKENHLRKLPSTTAIAFHLLTVPEVEKML